MNDEAIGRTTDPDGREVVFDEGSRRHLEERRWELVQHIDTILATVALPDHRALDPEVPTRERFYRRNVLDPGRWLRVVVDFNATPGRVVTVFVQNNDPRKA
jgi:hypothetical protein